MPKKYELVEQETLIYEGKEMRRVRALMDFLTADGHQIKNGDLGGYIESAKNLSQSGTAWVMDDAIVVDGAKVKDNALACGEAIIRDKAVLADNAVAGGCCVIGGRAVLSEQTHIFGELCVAGAVKLRGNAIADGKGTVSGLSA